MAQKKTTLGSKKNHKFTLKQFAWNGFNVTVGVPFLGSLALLANSNENGGQGLGLHILWIFLVMGIIASICAFAFTKLSRHHKQANNGGAYIFARSAFGRFVGFLILFLNYIIMPLVLSNQILMLVKANFEPGMATPNGTEWWNGWTGVLGNWDNLTYDFIGILLCIIFVIVAFLGTKAYKKVTKYSVIIKWISSGFLILFGIVAACIPVSSGSNPEYWANNSHLSISNFLSAFCACFYYFTGFEAFASSGATIEEPEKNIGKGIMIVMIASTAFYVILAALFFLAQQKFAQNVSTGFWLKDMFRNNQYLKWLIWAGPIIMIVSTVATRGFTISMVVLYGGTTLQPMSIEGYISNNFNTMNDDGFPIKAMKLNIIICLFTIAIWAIIPDIIVGIVGKQADFINVNTIISAASIFYILIYLIILLTVLKFSFKGLIKTGAIESALYIISLLSLLVVAVYHFYQLGDNAFNPASYIKNGVNKQIDNIAALAIEIGFIVACALFIWIVYFRYYRNKYTKRLAIDPSIQAKLNYEFRIFDGWEFLKGKTTNTVNNFMKKREKFVQDNKEIIDSCNFLTEYTLMTELFIMSIRNDIAKYIARGAKIEDYDRAHGNDVEREIKINNKDANNFLFQMQKKVRVGPSYKI